MLWQTRGPMPALGIELAPLIEIPNMMSGIWRRFGLHVFQGKITLDDMNRMEQVGDSWLAKNPGRVVELSVIFPSDAKMTSEERTRMVQIIKRWDNVRDAAGTVILADGLLGAMHRSVLTGMLMLARQPHPAKVFSDIGGATRWIAPHVWAACGTERSHDELLAAVRALCARFQSNREKAGGASSTLSRA